MLVTDYFINYIKYGILGNSLRIDASNACQLRCPTCHQAIEEESSFERKNLKVETFKNFIEHHPTFRNIEISDQGEIFLNPQLEDILQYAYAKKITIMVRNGVNLNYATDRALESLVKYKVKTLLVSIDGASNETYKIFRQRGDINKVFKNIETINRYKKQYRSKFPVLIWQFIIFGHNEHEIPLARQMAQRFNMRFFLKFNNVPSYAPIKDGALVKKETGFTCVDEYEKKTNNVYQFFCHQLWMIPQIGPDGDLFGCCYNKKANVYGNVFESGLQKVFKSEKFIYAKQMLLGRKAARRDIPCFNCKVYQNMRATKTNVFSNFIAMIIRLMRTHL